MAIRVPVVRISVEIVAVRSIIAGAVIAVGSTIRVVTPVAVALVFLVLAKLLSSLLRCKGTANTPWHWQQIVWSATESRKAPGRNGGVEGGG
jgi:hypothetical protein